MNGVGGNENSESTGTNAYAAFGEESAYSFHGAVYPFLCGLAADAQLAPDFRRGFFFEIAIHHCVAVRIAQFAQRIV